MQVLAIFLVIFLGVSLLLRVPVAFGIGLAAQPYSPFSAIP